MTKYIDAEKLFSEIERLRNECTKSISIVDGFVDDDFPKTMTIGSAVWVCDQLLSFIESMEKEYLPSNLDEAAEESAESWRKNPDGSESREIFFQPHIRGFKAGAEWMAGQGESHETEIVSRVTGNGLLPAVTCLVNKSYKEGDKVVVQIRKK